MLYDVHAHMDMLSEKELEKCLQDAKAKNVSKIVSCSTSFESNKKNISLSKKNKEIFAAIGLYPLNVVELNEKELDKAFSFFEKNIKSAKAIGEIGLDFKRCIKKEEQEKQQFWFSEFISLSNKYKKPLIIHSRFAQRQVIEQLEQEKAEKVLLHSFVDSIKLMKKAASLDYFVSVGPSIFKNEQIQKNIFEFSLENLLFETDSPIMFDNEKVFSEKIAKIASKTAELKSLSFSELELQQEKNFKTLFGWFFPKIED